MPWKEQSQLLGHGLRATKITCTARHRSECFQGSSSRHKSNAFHGSPRVLRLAMNGRCERYHVGFVHCLLRRCHGLWFWLCGKRSGWIFRNEKSMMIGKSQLGIGESEFHIAKLLLVPKRTYYCLLRSWRAQSLRGVCESWTHARQTENNRKATAILECRTEDWLLVVLSVFDSALGAPSSQGLTSHITISQQQQPVPLEATNARPQAASDLLYAKAEQKPSQLGSHVSQQGRSA